MHNSLKIGTGCAYLATTRTNLQNKYNTHKLNYQIYHNYCQFFVVGSFYLFLFLVFFLVSDNKVFIGEKVFESKNVITLIESISLK